MDPQRPPAAVPLEPAITGELFDLLPHPAGLVSASGWVLWTNRAGRELFGWDPSERPRLHLSELIDPQLFGFTNEIQHRMVSGEMGTVETHARMKRLDGQWFEADVRLSVVRHGADQEVGMLGTVTATSQGAFEHDPFRRALDHQRELICEWAPDGTIVYVNQAYCDYFDLDARVIGVDIESLGKWPDGERPCDMAARLQRGEPAAGNTRWYDEHRAVEWTNTPVRSEDGELITVFSVGRDVHDRLLAEVALRRNEEKFRMMVTYIWDSILLLDAEGNLVDATSTYREDLDYPSEYWQHANFLDVVHPDDHDAASTALDELVNGGPKAQAWMELRALRADGTLTWLELNGANLLDDPAVHAIILTVRNIDNRKKIEAELARRHEESQDALRRREAFVAQVSHELRNPLHGMLGLSEVLANAPLHPALREAASALFRQSSTMRRIVDDLLDVAQLEVGSLRVHHDRVDLLHVLSDAVVVAAESSMPGVTVTGAEPSPNLRYVMGDVDRIQQAVGNLLSNACKHTHLGQVRLEVARGEAPGTVRITVLDTGTGIDPDDIPRLFEAYERGPHASGAGVGLGLAIVKGTVEAMSGTVGAAPRSGGGSMFWIELPMAAAPTAAPSNDTLSAEFLPLRALDVIVVDDDPVNLLVAGLQLKALNAAVTTAADGESAWALLRDQRFDVAFIDVQMPGISGLELVRRVREEVGSPPLLAVMTASATAADQQAAIEAGADCFVAKPATAVDIAEVLRVRCEQLA